MHTAFQEKVQNGPGAALDGVDAQTRELFSRYQRHFEQVFRKAAQDPEEVTEVGAGQGSVSRGGPGVLAPSPRQRVSNLYRRSSSPLSVPRRRPCATSAPSASCPWHGCAWPTPAAAATSPPCTAQCSATRQPRVQRVPRQRPEPENWGAQSWVFQSWVLLPLPRNKDLVPHSLPLSPLRAPGVCGSGESRGGS